MSCSSDLSPRGSLLRFGTALLLLAACAEESELPSTASPDTPNTTAPESEAPNGAQPSPGSATPSSTPQGPNPVAPPPTSSTLDDPSPSGQGSASPIASPPSPAASDAVDAGAAPTDTMLPEPGAPPTAPGAPAPPDDSAVAALQEYLETPRQARQALEEQPFAHTALTREQAERARDLLWEDHALHLQETRSAEHAARELSYEQLRLRYDFTVFGEAPPTGRSLYLSLHGGGNAEPSVNDAQWENQKVLYQPDEGIYLSPRAPTDTWNLWHEAHIDPLFERLIANLIVLEGVDPDRVYLMGYSAGGDGVYQLAPRMADHWAAAAAMAGHPNEAQPLNLRNLGFTIHVGELDTAYDRNLIAVEWSDWLEELSAADPGNYVHEVQVHAGKPHWMDLEDAVAVPWMAAFTRDPLPSKIVWYQDDITHTRFYWLAVPAGSESGGTLLTAERSAQTVTLSSDDVERVLVRLNDDLVDLDVEVVVQGPAGELWRGVATRSIAVLVRTLEERGDPRLVFSAEVEVAL